MSVQLHNMVNKMHNKKLWSIEKARNHYNSIEINKNMIRLFFMNYIQDRQVHYSAAVVPRSTRYALMVILPD